MRSTNTTQFGVTCNDTPLPYGSSNGPLASCAPAPAGPLYGIDRYLDFFTRPGGVLFVSYTNWLSPSDPR